MASAGSSPSRTIAWWTLRPSDGALHVEHLEHEAVAGDQSGVGGLAAGLGVERGLGEDQLDLLALLGHLDQGAVEHDAAHGGFAGESV